METRPTLPLPLSYPLWHYGAMRTGSHQCLLDTASRPEIVAAFGEAQILKHAGGRLEIQGGTEEEKGRAHKWMKQFLTRGLLTLRRVG